MINTMIVGIIKNARLKGSVVKVIYDGIDYDRQAFIGRAAFQAPDIDGVVYFTSDSEVRIGIKNSIMTITTLSARGSNSFPKSETVPVLRAICPSVFRSIAARKNLVLAADIFGKYKTVTQDASIIVLL